MKEAAQFFRVLADEARLKILWLLFNHQELCVCDIMAALEITQSKASRHLANLRHLGLVADRKEGLWSYYTLCPIKDLLIKEHLDLLRTSLARHPDARQLLEKLNAWFQAKSRGAKCFGDGTRPPATKNKKRVSPRVLFAGGTQ